MSSIYASSLIRVGVISCILFGADDKDALADVFIRHYNAIQRALPFDIIARGC